MSMIFYSFEEYNDQITANPSLPIFFGSKGENLLKLSNFLKNGELSNFKVPSGVLIPASTFVDFCNQEYKKSGVFVKNLLLEKLSQLSKLSRSQGKNFLTTRTPIINKNCQEEIQSISKECRRIIEDYDDNSLFLKKLSDELLKKLRSLLPMDSSKFQTYAIRSSGLDEDGSEFTFAGLHDTYLNIPVENVVSHVKKCWASLFSERALTYRLLHSGLLRINVGDTKNEEKKFALLSSDNLPEICVVVQEMVPSVYAAGVLFTANPSNFDRRVSLINVGYGLGEGIVSGTVNTDTVLINQLTMKIQEKKISQNKTIRITSAVDGISGTKTEDVPILDRERQVLPDSLILELTRIGIVIQKCFDDIEQDIEFAVNSDNQIFILQARPITTLFPKPMIDHPYYELKPPSPLRNPYHFLNSFSHAEVMLDPWTPYGQSCIQLLFNQVAKAGLVTDEVQNGQERILFVGGRAYQDVTDVHRIPGLGFVALQALKGQETWSGKAAAEYYSRPDVQRHLPRLPLSFSLFIISTFLRFAIGSVFWSLFFITFEKAKGVYDWMKTLTQNLGNVDNIKELQLVGKLERLQSHVSQNASMLLSDYPMFTMLATMGALQGACKRDPSKVENLIAGIEINGSLVNKAMFYLVKLVYCHLPLLEYIKKEHASGSYTDDDFPVNSTEFASRIRANVSIDDCKEFLSAWDAFIKEYGCRGLGEIDNGRDGHAENVSYFVAMVVNSPNGGQEFDDLEKKRMKQEEVRKNARKEYLDVVWKEDKWKWWNIFSFGILGYMRQLWFGRCITVFQDLYGFREDHRHHMLTLSHKCKLQIFSMASSALGNETLPIPRDLRFLHIGEIIHSVKHKDDKKTMELMKKTIQKRKLDMIRFNKLQNVPRALNGFGEQIEKVVQLEETKNLPKDTLVGDGVSFGVVEGTCRVVLDPLDAIVLKGEIIVARNIDPAFTALFANCAGIISECGSAASHGVVVAREMSIPAVVSVIDCTLKLKTGQRIKMDGALGWIRLVD